MLYHRVSFAKDVIWLDSNPCGLRLQEMKLNSKIIDDGRALEQFFDALMAKWLPGYSTRESEDDERHKFPLKKPRQSVEM